MRKSLLPEIQGALRNALGNTAKPQYDADQRHKLALFEGLVGFVGMSAQAIGDMADDIPQDRIRDSIEALEEIAAEAETLRRLCLDANAVAAKCKQ